VAGDTYYGIEFIEDGSNTAGELGFFGYDHSPGQGLEEIPMMFPVVHQDLSTILGRIITGWSLLDCFIAEAAGLLVAYNGGSAKPRDLETANRMRLFEKEFSTAFVDHPEILKYLNQRIMTPAWNAKLIRDLVGHAQIVGSPNAGNPYIRFVTKKLGRRVIKEFNETELSATAIAIHQAAGHIHRICSDPRRTPLSSQDISRLQHVLAKDRWIAAIDRALRLPPRPSRPKQPRR
jgi:hypothetical protein